MSKRIGMRAAAWLAGLLGIAAAAAPTFAQSAPAEQTSPSALLADRLVVLAQVTLAGKGPPRPDQLVRARVLLDEALHLVPDDADLWRLRGELAGLMNDPDAQRQAWRRLAALDARDDVVQLRRVRAARDDEQTREKRWSAAERLLDGPEAGQLSPALRSRVASFVARGARETGDQQRLAERLKQALALDPANPEAARLLHDLVLARQGSTLEAGLALVTLVRADPADGEARAALAAVLLGEGAYEAAVRQFAAARLLETAADPLERYSQWVRSLIGAGQGDEALGRLEQLEAALAQAHRAPGGEPAASPARLPPNLEFLRVAILDRRGDAAAARAAAEADAAFARLSDLLRQRGAAHDPQASGDLAWASVLFGRALEEASAALDRYAQGKPADDPVVQRTRGWLALRQQQTDLARELLEPLAADDPFAAYGLALTHPAGPRRLAHLRQAQSLAPASLAGVLAAQDLLALRQRVDPTPAGATLAQRVSAWPRWLRSPDPQRDPVTVLSVAPQRGRYSYLDPIIARVTLRNATDAPLSLGGGGALPTRLLVVLSVRRGGQDFGRFPPVVIDVGRRLRLEPRESLEFPVRLDRGALGAMLAAQPEHAVTLVGTAVLDPQPGPGGLSRGPLGATAAIPAAERGALPHTAQTVDRLIAALPTAEGVDQYKALAALLWFTHFAGDAAPPPHPPGAPPRPESDSAPAPAEAQREHLVQARRIAGAVNPLFPQLDPAGQAWVLAMLPPTSQARALFAPIHEAAQRSDEVLVRVVYLAAHVSDPRSPAVNAALRQADTPLAAFARALRVALEQPAEGGAAEQ